MYFFLFILIVFSGLEIYGRPVLDVLVLGGFLLLHIVTKNSFKIKTDMFAVFCVFMIFQVIRGIYVLNDFRMLYWLFFFVITYFSREYFVKFFLRAGSNHQFVEKVFKYSTYYFLIYGVLGFAFSNDINQLQGVYWVGSSAAFIIIIPLLASHFFIYKNSGYRFSGLRIYSLFICVFCIVIHHSRSGLYLLALYIVLLVIHIYIYKPKKFISITLFLIISICAWDLTAREVAGTKGIKGQIERGMELIGSNAKYDSVDVGSDIGRLLMIQSIYYKFISDPVELLFGSGWYTSRETLKPYALQLRSRFGLSVDHLDRNKPLQVITWAAILSDTGVVGFIFIFYFFIKSSIQLLKINFRGQSIMLMLLFSNWLFYLVGYTYISVISFLLFLPNGILPALAHNSIIQNNKKKNG